jgi:hypothetical protein
MTTPSQTPPPPTPGAQVVRRRGAFWVGCKSLDSQVVVPLSQQLARPRHQHLAQIYHTCLFHLNRHGLCYCTGPGNTAVS